MTTPDLQTQVDLLRPAAIRGQLRETGFHPDTKNGERLAEWATAQASENGRIPTVRDLLEQATKWGLQPEPVPRDPATIEHQIAEARAEGDYATASRLQYAVDRERNRVEQGLPTAEEQKALDEVREQAQTAEDPEEARALWREASRLQGAIEGRLQDGVQEPVTYPEEYQPTGGLSQDQQELLEDDEKPLKDRLDAAMEQGDHVVASLLQTRLEREQATA